MMRWGMMSVVGTGMGNCVKTGSRAVDIGIACSRLDGWFLIRIFMSFVVRILLTYS